MKYISTLIISLFVLINLNSCSSDKQTSNNYLHFEKKTIEEQYGICKEDSACGKINIEYPIFSDNNKKVDDTINSDITKSISVFYDAKTIEETSKKFIKEYSDFINEFPDAPSNRWYMNMIYTVNNNTEKVLALKFYTEGYTGGAHGFRMTTYTNYNPKTGEKLKLSDVVTDVDKVTAIAKDVLIKDYKLDANKSLNDQGFWFVDDIFKLNDNFEVSPKGITFHYNQYDIAPYSMGPIEINIPMNKLEGLMK